MQNLKKIKTVLKKIHKNKNDIRIRIPRAWSNESSKLYTNAIEYIIKELEYIENLNIKTKDRNLGDRFFYSFMPRLSSAFSYKKNNEFRIKSQKNFSDKGSFLKSILILRYLHSLSVDTIYLLPVFERSLKNKKGEAGSPYAVKNFFKLDSDLQDDLLKGKLDIDTEFKAFIEAAHKFGMKVIIDFIPRTSGLDNDLIAKHPEWFYWIKTSELNSYEPPRIKGVENSTVISKKIIKKLFDSNEFLKHIQKFSQNPRAIDKNLFDKCITLSKKQDNLLNLIEENFSITVASAFSDVVNDDQPAWTDVTYLRLYLDHPSESQKEIQNLKLNINPYIAFDVAKASVCKGKVENKELWNLLASVLPYFYENYDIDGARLDMGHALPDKLIKLIHSKIKELDPNFILIAEELDTKNAKKAKKEGYDLIVGDAFWRLREYGKKEFNQFFENSENLELPTLACAETHDTPRLASKKIIQARLSTKMSFFAPNSINFINSGQEFLERAPMNLGLGASKKDLFILDKNNLNYAKLGLFDYCFMDWTNIDGIRFAREIRKIAKIRRKYDNSDSARTLSIYPKTKSAIASLYQKEDKCLIAICNHGYDKDTSLRLKTSIKNQSKLKYKILYSNKSKKKEIYILKEYIELKVNKGEFLIFEIYP